MLEIFYAPYKWILVGKIRRVIHMKRNLIRKILKQFAVIR
jgi:hypothetical protein